MGRSRRETSAASSALLREAKRLGSSDENLEVLADLERAGNIARTPREARAVQRARSLVRGRGWPTDRIEVFFSDKEDVHLPHMVSANAVLVPRNYSRDISEASLVRTIVHEMVHSRAAGLPSREEEDYSERMGLYQVREALTEMIAESIMPSTGEIQNRYPLLQECRHWVEGLCQEAGLSVDDVERLSDEEAMHALVDGMNWSLDDLDRWMQERIAEHRASLLEIAS